MNPFGIALENPGYFYVICYITAFLVAFIVLTIEGIRRRFAILPWWLIIATTFLFFIIGSQVIQWRAEDWQLAMNYQKLSEWPGRSVLGGILLFVPALLLAKRILKFRHNVVDTFAFMFPAGLAIQRIGCLIAGCCHGTPTSWPLSIQYNASSPAFHHQLEHGIISSNALMPVPVHPAQLYDLVCCLVILLILCFVKKRVRADGSLLAVSLFFYGFFRFFLEGLRAQEHESYFYLNTVQIVLLVLLPLIAFLVYRIERRVVREVEYKPVYESSKKYFGYCFGLILLFLLVSRWLSLFEVISFNLVLIPILSLVVWNTYHAVTLPSLRVVTIGLMVLSLFFMNQTYPEYGKEDKKLSYWTMGFGTMAGTTNSYAGVYQGSCGPGYSRSDNNDYSAKAIEISHVKQINKNESLILGLNGFWGNHNHSYGSSSSTFPRLNESNSSLGFNPYFQYNWEQIGIGGGFSVGNFTRINTGYNVEPSYSQKLNFYPSFTFRAGRIQDVSFEYRFANQFPSPYPALTHQVSLVVAIGKRGGVFRIGTGSNAGFIIAPSFTFGDHLILEPFLSFGSGLFNGDGADDHSSNMAMISAHFKFNRKER